MSKERLYIFDTTLRDGEQTQGVDFSLEDKETKTDIDVNEKLEEVLKDITSQFNA